MISINWEIAPERATLHGLYVAGGEIKEAWLGECQFQQIGHQKAFPYGGKRGDGYHNPRPHDFCYVTQRPDQRPVWSGEGLPPVGIECEVIGANHEYTRRFNGQKVRILMHHSLASGDKVAVFEAADDEYHALIAECFKPIRTPEQIAAEEREAAIDEMCGLTSLRGRDGARIVMGELYDAGYRKLPGAGQ